MTARRAGARWRLLVHDIGGKRTARHVQSHPDGRGNDGVLFTTEVLAGTEFDELVVGRWLHVEQTGPGHWWMDVGGVVLWVTADRDGRPKRVTVYAPGEYGDPVEGCTYEGAVAP